MTDKPGCDCGRCNPRGPRGTIRTPEQLAAMRESIAAGREYVAGLKREDKAAYARGYRDATFDGSTR